MRLSELHTISKSGVMIRWTLIILDVWIGLLLDFAICDFTLGSTWMVTYIVSFPWCGPQTSQYSYHKSCHHYRSVNSLGLNSTYNSPSAVGLVGLKVGDAASGLVGVLAWCSKDDDQPLLAPRLLPWKLSINSSCLVFSSFLHGKNNLEN